jgi:hypothetical protein
MLKYVFFGALIFSAPFLVLLLASLPNPWLYLVPLAVAVTGAIVNARPPSRTL